MLFRSLADWLKIDQKSYANRLKLCVPVLAVGAVLGIGNALGKIDYNVIWRYFSWSNQTLAMIVLWAASMYLFQQKKNYWITAIPATFMSAVSSTYFILGEECLGQLLNKHEVVDGARKLVAYNTALAYPVASSSPPPCWDCLSSPLKSRPPKPESKPPAAARTAAVGALYAHFS